MKKTKPEVRALVLAAGQGTRLRPLTETLPKPLIPIQGSPLVAHTLDRLRLAGVRSAALNLHHLGETVRRRIGDHRRDLLLTYSYEETLLGTLGALAPLREFLQGGDLALLINGDSLCRWPIKKLIHRHLKSGARATLLLTRRPNPKAYGGGVGVDKNGRVVSFRPSGLTVGEVARRHVFAGAHVLSPDLLDSASERPSDIVTDLYEPLLAAGARLQTLTSGRRWHDLGTPRRYLEGLLDWVQGIRPWPRCWVSPQARLSPSAKLSRTVVEAGARVGPRARLRRSLVMPGASVGRGARLRRVVVGPSARIPDEARIEERLITTARAGWIPSSRDTVIGNLALTPLDP